MNDSAIIAAVAQLRQPSAEQSDQAIARTREALLAEIAQLDELATIETPALVTRRRASSRFVRRAVGIAACAILALGISWSFMASTSSVAFAQVIEAIQKATTAHCVIKEEKDGEWIDTLEFWYSHSQGIYERKRNEKGERLRIDDGSHLWVYQEGADQAIVAQSIGAKGMIDTLLEPLSLAITFHRDSSRDRGIAGTHCRYHRATVNADELYEAWLDKEDRLRLFIASTKAKENWNERIRCSVSYDVPVEANRFQPTFGNNVRIVDLSAGFGSLFPLEKAIYRTTEHGFDIGVHELRTVSPTAFLAVVSFRPTLETRKQNPLERQGEVYGQFRAGSHVFLDGGVRQKAIHLAKYEADGISVHAYLFDHTAIENPFVLHEAMFTMEIMPRHLMKLPESPTVRFTIPLPATDNATDDATTAKLEKAIEELYTKAVAVEQLPVDTVALALAPRAPTEKELQERAAKQRESVKVLRGRNSTMVPWVKPSESTLEHFLSDIKSQLEE